MSASSFDTVPVPIDLSRSLKNATVVPPAPVAGDVLSRDAACSGLEKAEMVQHPVEFARIRPMDVDHLPAIFFERNRNVFHRIQQIAVMGQCLILRGRGARRRLAKSKKWGSSSAPRVNETSALSAVIDLPMACA